MKKKYYRFGELPEKGLSAIWRGEKCIGYEKGVSAYEAYQNLDGKWVPVLPLPKTDTTWDSYCYYMNYFRGHHYLIEGEYIGKGSDGEPILSECKIIEILK